MIYETDTDMVAIWNGTTWRYISATTPTNGTVLQTVYASTSTEQTNNTATYADTTLTATITPKAASSKVLVQIVQAGCYVTTGNGENRIQVVLNRAGSDVFDMTGTLHQYSGSATIKIGQAHGLYLDSPATTSATIYKTRFRNVNGTASVLVQAGAATSTIVLQEIAA